MSPLEESAPPAGQLVGPGQWVDWVTVETYSHPNQATGPRIRLEAEGIPTHLDGERVAGNTHYQVATGGARLQVPAPLASEARILIDQKWAAPEDPDDDLEDAWDGPRPPSRGSGGGRS